MRPYLNESTLIYITIFVIHSAIHSKELLIDPSNAKQVRGCLSTGCLSNAEEQLVRMGQKAFPAYEAILSDPKAKPDEIGRIFYLLSNIEADRRHFAKYAVLRLTDADLGSKINAVLFLSGVGSAADTSPVVALLFDEDLAVVAAAAKTLASIGGPNEVVAMDVWLRGASDPRKKVVQYYRDELKKRLEEDKELKKRAHKIQKCWTDLLVSEYLNPGLNRAVWNMTEFRIESVVFLKNRVRTVPAEEQKHLDELVAELDSDNFDRRESATRELSRGVVAEAILEKELKNRPSLEKRRRLEVILEDFPKWREKNPELLRQFRAVWVLQQIGTPEARALLEKLAAGAPSAALTHKAKDALQSLDRLKKK